MRSMEISGFNVMPNFMAGPLYSKKYRSRNNSREELKSGSVA
jgi:hypothetical protein